MTRSHRFTRPIFLFSALLALLLTPSLNAEAKGKGFKDVVKHIEKQYGAKKTRIPMLGLASFAVKLVRPAGVKGFKLAVFEDQSFAAREGALAFDAVMRESYKQDWQPLVQINSRKEGNSRTFIYAKFTGKDAQFAVLTLQEREAVVLEVKFNPDAAARFLENPKIMGISLGNSIRGNGGGHIAGGMSSGNASSGTHGRGHVIINGQPQPWSGDKTTNANKDVAAVAPVISSAQNENAAANRPALSAANDENSPPATVNTEVKPTLPKDDTLRIETRLVNLNVKAMNRGGQPLTDLKLGDFSVYEDGVKQEVAHFKPVNAPVNLILLLDLSGSTKKNRKTMRQAAERFIDALPAQDKVAVVAFTRRYRTLINFSNDKLALKTALKEINGIAGGTAFYDSLWQAVDQLKALGEARKAVVVLTDGEDESLLGHEETTHNFEQLLGRVAEEDVTIYPIYFSAQNHYRKLGVIFDNNGSLLGNDKSRTARKQLEQLAEQTGGEVFSAQREEELEGAYQRVANELHTLYSLAYAPDKLKNNGEFRKITVKVSRDGAVAKTRRGYYDK
jgi:VWFA-related protein